LEPSDIFKGEVEETIEKVTKAVGVLHSFKKTYEDHKGRVKSYFPEGSEAKEWEFAPELVFARYDQFVNRVEIVKVNNPQTS